MKKILITIIAFTAMLCVLVLAGCEHEHEHEWGEWKTAKEPTCTEKGVEERVCKCGEKETKEIDALGHINGDWIIDAEPTCTAEGSKHQICSVCKETLETEILAALGHSKGEWITDSEPTCTAEGSKHQICSVCNETIKTEDIPATGHTEGEWITDSEPTCTEPGTNLQLCSVCKEIINGRPVDALGHDYTETITKATEESKAKVKLDCNICQESHTEDVEQISVSAQLTGSGMTMTGGGMYYTRSFEVTATGGYGEYMYKFESGSNLLQDFSTSNEIEIYGNVFVDAAIIKITVMDEAGQKTVYEIKGNGSFVDSYVIYE